MRTIRFLTSSARSPHRAVAAIALVVAMAAGGAAWHANANAASPSVASEYVPITPCRLADTRPGLDNVGSRNTKIGAGESVRFAVWASNGQCAIPASATGIASNVTAVNPTAASFMTVYPDDATLPLASNLNYAADSSPTPNQVTVGLSATGGIRVYNLAGSIDVIIDIVGYYQPATSSSGPAGPDGPPGISGYEVVFLNGLLQVGQRDGQFEVNCPAGKKVLGGGVATFNKDIDVTANTPVDSGDRWVVSTTTFSGNNILAISAVNVRVICAFVEP